MTSASRSTVCRELDNAAEQKEAHRKAGDGHSTSEFFHIEPIEGDDPRLSSLANDWIELGVSVTGPRAQKGPSRSEPVFAFICECVRQGISDNVIASCLMNWKIGAHIREQSNVPRSLRRNIARAKEYVADSELFKMNEKYVVMPIGGKTRVVTWGEDQEFPGRRSIVMNSTLSDFQLLHNKYRHVYMDANGDRKEVRKGSWWISHPGRRQFDSGMKFMPNRDVDVVGNTMNMWQGFQVAARKPEGKSGAAGCKLFLDHGLKIICTGMSSSLAVSLAS